MRPPFSSEAAARAAALPVVVESARVDVREVQVAGYGGPRPTSVLTLQGRGAAGRGEHVGWTRSAHGDFAAAAADVLLAGEGAVIDVASRPALFVGVAPEEARYRRAALEGALLELAFAQSGLSWACFGAASPPRHVLSFSARPDPAAHARAILAHDPSARLKVDVDPAWSDDTLADLASVGAVEILDGKARGDAAFWRRVRRHFPATLLEDPTVPSPPFALDRPLVTLSDVDHALAVGAWVNIKAPRMGGVLVAMEALGRARDRGGAAYVGGMFEVGPGRALSRSLAACFTPGGPNDVAPLVAHPTRGEA